MVIWTYVYICIWFFFVLNCEHIDVGCVSPGAAQGKMEGVLFQIENSLDPPCFVKLIVVMPLINQCSVVRVHDVE